MATSSIFAKFDVKDPKIAEKIIDGLDKERESKRNPMIPKLGQKIYYIYEEAIIADKVYALGKDVFIVESYGRDTVEETWEHYYEEYGKKWFTRIDEAKRALRERYEWDNYGCKCKIDEIEKGVYWEAVAR